MARPSLTASVPMGGGGGGECGATRARKRRKRPRERRLWRRRDRWKLAACLGGVTLLPLAARADSPTAGGLSRDFFQFSEQGGENVFRAICAGCHMPDGRGAQGAGHYPALAGNAALQSSDYVLHNVLYGRRGMPGFAKGLDDQQAADVVNYVRGSLGNHFAGPVTPAQVKAARPAAVPAAMPE